MSLAHDELFAVACPGCRATVAVSRGLIGEAAGCPLCDQPFLVPDPGAVPVPQPPAEPVASESPAEPPAPAAVAGPASVAREPPDRPGRQPPRRPAADRPPTRSRRTILIMLGGITILVALAAMLSRRSGRRR